MGAALIDTSTDFSDIVTQMRTEGDKFVVQRTQDATPYLEQNKREMAEAPSWRPYANANGMRKVASIPLIVVEQWMKEGVNILDPSPETQKKIAQKLNSNEYQYLRTHPGKVGWKT